MILRIVANHSGHRQAVRRSRDGHTQAVLSGNLPYEIIIFIADFEEHQKWHYWTKQAAIPI